MCHIFYVFRDVGASMLSLFLVIGAVVGVGIACVCALRYGLLNADTVMHCLMATDALPRQPNVNEDLFEHMELGSMLGLNGDENGQDEGGDSGTGDASVHGSNPDNGREEHVDNPTNDVDDCPDPNSDMSTRNAEAARLTPRPSPKKYAAPQPPRYDMRSGAAGREFDLCNYCLHKQFNGKPRNKGDKCTCVRRGEA